MGIDSLRNRSESIPMGTYSRKYKFAATPDRPTTGTQKLFAQDLVTLGLKFCFVSLLFHMDYSFIMVVM